MRRTDLAIPVPPRSADVIARLRQNADEAGLFADAASRKTYLSLLLHYMSWDRRWLDEIRLPLKDMYFFTDALEVGQDEILIDGGAFDGDTIEAFRLSTKDRYAHIHSFEADPNNLPRLRLRAGATPRISIHPVGLWSGDCILRMSSGNDASAISSDGDQEIACRSLDDIGLGAVTFIKLDIEGAEIPAIQGAAKTIRRDKPKLAIAGYHKPDDLMTIPQAIREIRDDYTFSLRHHSVYHNDSVIYAS